MKAVIVSRYGGPDVLQVEEVPEPPRAEHGEVTIRVMATALNRADVLQRKGHYPAPPGVSDQILGLEFAGLVTADIGRDVVGIKPGDRVYGLVPGGSYAQFVVAHHRTLAIIPDNLSFEQAAACPEAFVTAYDAMVEQAGMKSGEWVLIHAAGSGVGTAAIQLCKALGGRSIGTSRTEEKIEPAVALGLHRGIVVKEGLFSDEVLTMVPSGIDTVLELVGGAYLDEDLRCLNSKGRIVLIGLLAGAKVNVNLGMILTKRARIMGTTMRARPLEEKIAAGKLLADNISPLLAEGVVRPIIDKIFSVDDVVAAHQYMENNDSFGKVVLNLE